MPKETDRAGAGKRPGRRAPKQRERYYVKIRRSPLEQPAPGGRAHAALVEVDRDTYLAFYQTARALKTLEEKDRRHRVVSIDALPRMRGGEWDGALPPMSHAWHGGEGPGTSREHAQLEALLAAVDALDGEERALVEAYLERADEIVHSKSPRRIVSVRAIAPMAGVERHRAGKVLKVALGKLAADIAGAMDEFDEALADDAAAAFEEDAGRR